MGVRRRAILGVCERGTKPMTFQVGETVVYPHHGAALIEAMETRVVKGEERLYLVLKVAQGDLTGRGPPENAGYGGCRPAGAGPRRQRRVRRSPRRRRSGGSGPRVRGASRPAHRGADQLVAPLQG